MPDDRPLRLSSIAVSDLGLKRRNNEDAVLALPELGAFVVADGMGGTEAGEVASEQVVKSVQAALSGEDAGVAGNVSQKARLVTRALKDAGSWIWRYARENRLRSCGTTVVALLFDASDAEHAIALHAGDSRAYRFRDGLLEQVTTDHSLAEASGVADVKMLPPRLQGVITRAVGIGQHVDVEETPVGVADGDVFLLCSDGLTAMVRNVRIQEVLRETQTDTLETIAGRLVEEAKGAGGHDNISVVLVRIEALQQGTQAGVTTAGLSDTGPAVMTNAANDVRSASSPTETDEKFRDTAPMDPVPETIGLGFSTIVRLGLGLVAILLLILVLVTAAERRRSVVAASRQGAGIPDRRTGSATVREQPVGSAIPAIVGEEGEAAGTTHEATGDGIEWIPADTDAMKETDSTELPDAPSTFGAGMDTNIPVAE